MSVSAPVTPSKRYNSRSIRASEINDFTKVLSERYGLLLPIPRDGESPFSRRSSLRKEDDKMGDEIVWLITYLSRHKPDDFQVALQSFEVEADNLGVKQGWVYKSKEDDVIPQTSDHPQDSSGRNRRLHLLDCLLRILREVRQNNESVEPKTYRLRELSLQTELDSSPIPFNLGPRSVKRSSGGFDSAYVSTEFKKSKPPGTVELPKLIKTSDSISANSRQQDNEGHTVPPSKNSNTTALFFGRSTKPFRDSRTASANTSFASNSSTVFTGRYTPGTTTQASSANVSFESRNLQKEKAMGSTTSEYGSMDEDDFIEVSAQETLLGSSDVDMCLSDIDPSAQGDLTQRLQIIFPVLPQSLRGAPLCLRYEITRVFLHTEVPTDDLQIDDYRTLLDYNSLWTYLENLPQLQGKSFPEKSALKAWTSSVSNWTVGQFDGVVMSGSLKFNPSKSGPLFKLHFKPLTADRTHRLGRRFGNDRFLELTLPNLTKFQPRGSTDEELETRRGEIIHWLANCGHKFLGIEWKSFFVKDVKSKKINQIELKNSDDVDNNATHRVFFFAVDGVGFKSGKTPPMKGESPTSHTSFSVDGMLHWLIPFRLEKNKKQPYLKLFSRIALGLSKTYATVELRPQDVRFRQYDFISRADEVMNDGCGQMSRKLALHISQTLNLNYIPSSFQARIGGAKGMWIVNTQDVSDEMYLEIYPSQVKWDTGPKRSIEYLANPGYRTFEVLRWSGPVHSATLNLQFLPILEDRGRNNGKGMRDVLSRMLENGLTYEIGRQRAAMENPQSFRKWICETDPGITDRIKLGQVRYWAGMPKSQGEKINLLLDSGFNPKELRFLKDLAWNSYFAKCETLKTKLNISVGRSAYLPMVVDFRGILAPDEVHIGFSTAFKDETTDFCDTILSNMDVLVARSPAHYISDIQKVKAVFKPELSTLKDVVVFSTQGDFPLSGKLSGGDYDGDIAWVCWQPEIVNEFENAEMPGCLPDMIKSGYITKNSTTYAELSKNNPKPTDTFLSKSFEFNLKQNLLGICTNFKEKLCYTKNSVSCYEAIFLSTLLSSLVDQAKQGYTFTEKDWERLRKNEIRQKVKEPNYKRSTLNGNPKILHLIDHLKFRVAKETIDSTLAQFHESIQTPVYWDDDVVKLATFARKEAETSEEWATLLNALDSEIEKIRSLWTSYFPPSKDEEESKAEFATAIDNVYSRWGNINPIADTSLTRLLTQPYQSDAKLSTWELLKASVLFDSFRRKYNLNTVYVGNIVWWVAGKQLAHLKAMQKAPVSVIPAMYAMLKPDNTFVKLMQVDEHDPKFLDARVETELDEDEETDYED